MRFWQSMQYSYTTEFATPKNMGVDVGIMTPGALEAEILLGVIYLIIPSNIHT